MKTCDTCNESKSESEFYLNANGNLMSRCKECHKKWRRDYYKANRKRQIKLMKKYNKKHPEKIKKATKKFRENNPEIWKSDKYKDYRRRYRNKPKVRMSINLRRRLRDALKSKDWKKNSSLKKNLGCSLRYFKKYIEIQFKPGMSWANYGEWHLDHIIPLSSARYKRDLIPLSHFSNLQPLWAKENIIKSDNMPYGFQILKQALLPLRQNTSLISQLYNLCWARPELFLN